MLIVAATFWLVIGCATSEDVDLDGVYGVADCDDADGTRFPGAPERCDGVDQDCDGVIDDEPVDGLPFLLDEDRDGHGGRVGVVRCTQDEGLVVVGDDCDDLDATVHPGAPEACDGRDSDCDGIADLTDTDTVLDETYTVWRDADADGFGDPTGAEIRCNGQPAGAGVASNALDCDDGDANSHPGGGIDECDGHDNDCDGRIDGGWRVPEDYSTIQDAVDAAPDDATVCVGEGSYAPFSILNRSVQVSGRGSDVTVIDADGGMGITWEADDQQAVLSGFTVVGAVGTDGAALHAVGGMLDLDDVTFSGTTIEGSVDGLGRAAITAVHLQDVWVSFTNVNIDGTTTSPSIEDFYAALYSDNAWLSWEGGGVSGTDIDTTLTSPYSGSSVYATIVGVYGGMLSMRGLDFADNRITTTSSSTAGELRLHLFVFGQMALEASDIAVVDNTIVATPGEHSGRSEHQARIFAVDAAVIDGADLSRNHITLDAPDGDEAWAKLYTFASGEYRDVVSRESSVVLTGADQECYGYFWNGSSVVLERFDVRGIQLDCSDGLGSATLMWFGAPTPTIENSVFAGNAVTGDHAWFFSTWGTLGLNHDTVSQNAIDGSSSDEFILASALDAYNSVFDGNVVGTESSFVGPFYAAPDPLVLTLGWDDLYHNGWIGWMDDDGMPSVAHDLTAVDPAYASVTGSDPLAWDLHLDPRSPLVDAGDGRDADGTPADLGAYGGAVPLGE